MNDDKIIDMDFGEPSPEAKGEESKKGEVDVEALATTVAERVAVAVAQQMQQANQPAPSTPDKLPKEIELERLRQRKAELEKEIEAEVARDPASPRLAQLGMQQMQLDTRITVLEENIPLRKQLLEAQNSAQMAASIPSRVQLLVGQYSKAIRDRFPANADSIIAELGMALNSVGAQQPRVLFDDTQVKQLIELWIARKFMDIAPPYDPGLNAFGAPGAAKKQEKSRTAARIKEIAAEIGIDGDELVKEVLDA